MGVRTLAAWCPDWPVTAAGHGPDEAVAVVADGRVLACSPAARNEGVAPGLRRRQAESRCSGLVVVEHDPARDAREFEPVVVAMETAVPAVEVVRPGLCASPARGPARFYGSDHATAAAVRAAIVSAAPGAACRVGIADGLFAASQAARLDVIVSPGQTPAFLADLPVDVLLVDGKDAPDLADRFRRLGLWTLGALASLPSGAVTDRFGPEGARAHRLARGLDDLPVRPRRPPPELAVQIELDPPATGLDQVLFAARHLAVELAGRLEELVLGCTLLAIEAETASGQTLARRWRHEDGLTPDELAERARWQVEAWLLRSEARAKSGADADGLVATDGGIVRLRLVPELVHPERGRQLGLWGDRRADGAVARALARVQGMLGLGSVVTASLRGGRTPLGRVVEVPWGESRPDGQAAPVSRGRSKRRNARAPERPPWPGRIPPPAPATVHADPATVLVQSSAGDPIVVDDRGALSDAPAEVRLHGAPPMSVRSWAGPWPADERWWDPATACRRARLQVALADGSAHLLAVEEGRWLLEATYD